MKPLPRTDLQRQILDALQPCLAPLTVKGISQCHCVSKTYTVDQVAEAAETLWVGGLICKYVDGRYGREDR